MTHAEEIQSRIEDLNASLDSAYDRMQQLADEVKEHHKQAAEAMEALNAIRTETNALHTKIKREGAELMHLMKVKNNWVIIVSTEKPEVIKAQSFGRLQRTPGKSPYIQL